MKINVQRTNKKVLKICPQSDGSVTVLAYRFLSQKRIATYVAENFQWISSCLQKLCCPSVSSANTRTTSIVNVNPKCNEPESQNIKDIFAGKSVLLCGQLYVVKPSTHTQTFLQEDCLFLFEKQFANKELRLKSIKTFLKRMSSNVLSQEVSKLGSGMALCPVKIQFKDLHGRWCSCAEAETRAIVLDYRLIQLPQQLQTYVIAHAFAHFDKQGHGEDFFQHLSNYQPNYKDCQDAIANYNFLLDV